MVFVRLIPRLIRGRALPPRVRHGIVAARIRGVRVLGSFRPVQGICLALALLAPVPARALDSVTFALPGATEDLAATLRAASLTEAARREGRADAQEVFAAAQADYGRLLGALYAAGHYSGTISIRIDGREAADIAPLNAPARIGTVAIEVRPGPSFRFGRAEVAPVAPGTDLPPDFAPGQPALSGLIRDAAEAGVDGWRAAGHAKARVADQSLTADHPRAVLDARLGLAPGPLVRFGQLSFTGQSRMRLNRLAKIAGLPQGAVYSPEDLRKAADRLRRTGVFRSVALAEGETLGPGDTLDVTATVVEMPLRRLGFGAEVTSTEGGTLSAFWLHRNLLGGAERFRVEGEVTHIGLNDGGIDWRLGLLLERPASFTPDTTARLTLDFAREQMRGARIDDVDFGFGLSHIFSDRLTARADLIWSVTRVTDSTGARRFRSLSLPVGLTWDRRDDKLDPRRGFWLDAEAKPFLGFGSTGSGLRAMLDLRGFQPLGERVVLAGRLQGGIIAGAGLLDVPRDDLFWSGGGGTVRGQPFQSLGVNIGRMTTGGTRFVGGSVEVRGKVTDKIGVVGFFDYGRITDSRFTAAPASDWHAGAGLGVRYATPVGPIRLDLAVPAGGRQGDGLQFYLGIGQAF